MREKKVMLEKSSSTTYYIAPADGAISETTRF